MCPTRAPQGRTLMQSPQITYREKRKLPGDSSTYEKLNHRKNDTLDKLKANLRRFNIVTNDKS